VHRALRTAQTAATVAEAETGPVLKALATAKAPMLVRPASPRMVDDRRAPKAVGQTTTRTTARNTTELRLANRSTGVDRLARKGTGPDHGDAGH
jgi:hypothetical protein